jgi:hypothetical protein
MPILDGFAVLLFVSKQQVVIPSIVMSAHFSTDSEQRAEAAGAMVLLEKPVDIQQMTSHVRALLDARSSGFVEGVTLPGFVQLVQIERQNVTLRVETSSEAGLLHFTNGELTDAWDGRQAGDLAAMRIFGWSSVRIDMLTPRISNRTTVTLPATHLIMESIRLSDEEGRESPVTPPEGRRRGRTTAREFLAEHLDDSDASTFPRDRSSVRLPPRPRRPPTKTVRPPSEPTPTTTQTAETTRPTMSNTIQAALENIMKIDGTIGTCLCDWTSGLTLGFLGGQGRINIELAGSLNCQVVRAKMEAMGALGIKGSIEDILISLDDQYHLIRPLKKAPTVFLYVAIDRVKGNLGLARMKLQQIEASIEV